ASSDVVTRLDPDAAAHPSAIAAVARGESIPRGAFGEPFGPRFARGFFARPASVETALGPTAIVEDTPWLQIGAYAAGALAVAAASAAVWQGVRANAAYDDYQGTFRRDERDASAKLYESSRSRAIGFGVTASVGALAAIACTLGTFEF